MSSDSGDLGHRRLNAETDVFMTPSLKHRSYVPTPKRRGSYEQHVETVHVPLPLLTTACYSVGHFLNDACASVWFSYLLLYLTEAQHLNGMEAGAVLFSGQLADALATPIVGLLSDRSRGLTCGCFTLGRRKLWNFIGVVIVLVGFYFVFGECVLCLLHVGNTGPGSSRNRTIAFSVFAALFNVGWAAVQVSHMAMVPELTTNEGERVVLNGARYAFTVLANMFVFGVMWTILHFYDGGNENNKYNQTVYWLLTTVVLGTGGALSLMFLLGTREHVAAGSSDHLSTPPALNGELADVDGPVGTSLLVPGAGESAVGAPASGNDAVDAADGQSLLLPPGKQRADGGEEEDARHAPLSLPAVRGATGLGGARPRVMAWHDWLRMPVFYQVALVYMFVRLATNVSQVYLTFFVTQSLFMDQVAIAIVPLLVYVSQLLATVLMKRLDRRLGRRNSITLGAALFGAACACMFFLPQAQAALIYPAVLLLGVGSAITMVISVSLEADLVGRNCESAAFLYGAVSFTDKLSNGVVVLVIQFIGNEVGDGGGRAGFIRYVNSLVPLAAMGCAVLVAWTIRFPRHLRGSKARSAAAASAASDGSGSLNAGGVEGGGGGRSVFARIRSFMRSSASLDGLLAPLSPSSPASPVAAAGDAEGGWGEEEGTPLSGGPAVAGGGSAPLLLSADSRGLSLRQPPGGFYSAAAPQAGPAVYRAPAPSAAPS